MKSLKRILVFVLAQCGLGSLHAQQAPPPPAPPAGNPSTPGNPPKAAVAPVPQSAAAILATNVPPKPMTPAEEHSARDLLRNVKVQAPEKIRPRQDQFDNTFQVVPSLDKRTYEVVPGRLAPTPAPYVRTPGIVLPPSVVQPPIAPTAAPQLDPYALELISKARVHQAETTATAPNTPIAPATVPTPAPPVAPTPVVAPPPAAAVVPAANLLEDPYLAELIGKARANQAEAAATEARLQAATAPLTAPTVPAEATVVVPAPTPVPPSVVTSPATPAPVGIAPFQFDPYIDELIGKAQAHQRAAGELEARRQPEGAATDVAVPPATVVTPVPAPAITPQPSPASGELARKQAEEEFRRKEIARIEAEVVRAAEERRRREAAAVVATPTAPAVTPAPAPVVTPAPAPVVAPVTLPPPVIAAPTLPVSPASEQVVPMTSEAEAQARALLQQKTLELSGPGTSATPPASLASEPVVRCRYKSLSTKEMETLKRAAT